MRGLDPHHRDRLRGALDALDARRPAEARAQLDALEPEEDDPSAAALAARLRFLMRDYDAALALLDRTSQRHPAATYPVKLGYSLAARVRFEEEAGRWLARVLERAPSDRRARMAAVLRHREAGRLEEARREAERGAREHPSAAWHRMSAELAAATTDAAGARRAGRAALAREPDEWITIAEAYAEAGLFDELEVLLAARGDDPDALARRAELRLFAGALDQARSLAARSADPRARLVEAAAEVLRGEAAPGLDALEDEPTVLTLRAERAWRAGALDEAARWLARARDTVPDYLAAKLLWVIVSVDQGRDIWRSITAHSHEGLASQIASIGDDLAVPDGASAEQLRAIAARALERLGGNRTPRPTRVSGGSLARVRVPPSPRHRARRLQHRAPHLGIAATARAMDEAFAEHPPDAVARCYRAELDLWRGDYATSGRAFEAILDVSAGTTWAWIGLAASRLLAGDAEDGLATLDEGTARLGKKGATVAVYRGEALWRLGRLDEASRELEEATSTRPSRIAAWVLRALVDDERGRREARDLAFAFLEENATALVSDAAREAGVEGWWPRPARPEDVRAVCDAALSLLRGSRSSSCVLWFAPGAEIVRHAIAGRPVTTERWERDERAALRRALGS